MSTAQIVVTGAAVWLVAMGLVVLVCIGGGRVPVIRRRHVDHYTTRDREHYHLIA